MTALRRRLEDRLTPFKNWNCMTENNCYIVKKLLNLKRKIVKMVKFVKAGGKYWGEISWSIRVNKLRRETWLCEI